MIAQSAPRISCTSPLLSLPLQTKNALLSCLATLNESRQLSDSTSMTTAHMQAMARMHQAIPSMLSWVQRFLRPMPAKNATVTVRAGEGVAGGNLRPMCVRQVVDIEENVWAPKYGLKGMIDASLAASFHSAVSGLHISVLSIVWLTTRFVSTQVRQYAAYTVEHDRQYGTAFAAARKQSLVLSTCLMLAACAPPSKHHEPLSLV